MNAQNKIAPELTPQARLAISRKAIVRHMHHDDQNLENSDSSGRLLADGQSSESASTWGIIKRAVRGWWQHHPVSVAFELAEPVVSRYARDKPFKLLGIAAGAGVAIAVLKPWRLISLGGILFAAMKSSDISGAILSILSTAPNESSKTRTPQ